jgi:HEPN domain-containing protein
MHDKRDHARGWFRKAESDLHTAQRTLDSDGPYDTACFHAQQGAEKYLKGLLAFMEQPIPRTHNLEELQQLCVSLVSDLSLTGVDVADGFVRSIPAAQLIVVGSWLLPGG